MTFYSASNPFMQIFNLQGTGLNDGDVYFGVAGQDPITNPITVYWDLAGTDVAAQPIPTTGGYLYRSGTPAEIYLDSAYSIKVLDKKGGLVYYQANVNDALFDFIEQIEGGPGSGLIGFSQSSTYPAGSIGKHDQNQFLVTDEPFNAVGNGVADDTAAIQAAIDAAHALYLGGPFGGGGAIVRFPAGRYKYSGLTIKQGVSLQGEGSNQTTLTLSGVSSTGIKCAAADTQSKNDQVSYVTIEGLTLNSAESAPTSQTLWNMTGFGFTTVRNVLVEFFGGCNGITVINAKPASLDGPAQFQNEFYNLELLRPSAAPAGGYGILAGSESTTYEAVTDWKFFGGRATGGGSGTGRSFPGASAIKSFGFTNQGLNEALHVGAATGDRISSQSIFCDYYEGNVTDRYFDVTTASNLKSLWSFKTGMGAEVDLGLDNSFFDPDNILLNLSNLGTARFKMNDGSVAAYEFYGTNPAIWLTDTNGNKMVIQNETTVDGTIKRIRAYMFGESTDLFDFGTDYARWEAKYFRGANSVLSALGSAGGLIGHRAFVTDSTVAAPGNFGAIVAGGGTHPVPVFSDGSNWLIGG